MSYSIIEDIDDIIGPNVHQIPSNLRRQNQPIQQLGNMNNMGNMFNNPSSPSLGTYNNIDNYHSYNPQQASSMHDRNDVASRFYEKQARTQPRLNVQQHRSSVNNVKDDFQKTAVVDIINSFREEEIRISDNEKKEKKEKIENRENREIKQEFQDLTNIDVVNEIRRMSTVFNNLLQRHDDNVDILKKKIEGIEMTQKGILFLLFIILLLVLLRSNNVVTK